jgi:hypothetical protein
MFRTRVRRSSSHITASDQTPRRRRVIHAWLLAVIVALVLASLASIPQLHAKLSRGPAADNSFVSYYFDEPAYLTYLQGVIDGLPRRNDPYTGQERQTARTESLFSIQFLPAYALALPARWLGLTSSEAFIALRSISAFASAVAIFWLLQVFTNKLRIATVGTVVVFCLGCYIGSSKSLQSLFALNLAGYDFPFLRCFVPALPFPIFFVFCAAVWKALVSSTRAQLLSWAALGGFAFVVLLFSYFFLWTAAAAWLGCVALLLMVSPRRNNKRVLTTVGVVGAIGVCAMVPYVLLLLQRSPTMDIAQLLLNSHKPDFSHRSELFAGVIIVLLALAARRGLIDVGDYLSRLVLSFALLPFVLFNQQVITGHSLQPFHYELYVAPYSVAIAAVLFATLIGRGRLFLPALHTKQTLILACIASLIVVRAAATTTIMSSRHSMFQAAAAEKLAVLKKMHDKTATEEPATRAFRPVVFFTDLDQADMAPAIAPYLVLWSPHMFVFPGVSEVENRERLYRYLYFQGVTRQNFGAMASVNSYLSLALFGFERASNQDYSAKAIPAEDVVREQERYAHFISSFDLEHASALKIDYVVTQSQRGPDLSNFDRWYERYDAYSVGDFTIWRVKPRI